MKPKLMIPMLMAAAVFGAAPIAQSATPEAAVVQQNYSSPEEVAAALATAARAGDRPMILKLMGADSASWLSSGDATADREDWKRFLDAYERKHTITPTSDDHAVLLIGDDAWPFPAPLVRQGSAWRFDAVAGREEVLRRRIGRNELDAMQTLLAVVDAQREYASGDLDGNGFYDYARRFISTAGKRDGLYWPVSANEPPSPLGPLVGAASVDAQKQGAGNAGAGVYHGYRYRLLEAQGKAARGGAYDYRVGGKLIGGFAVVAYPAKHGNSGVSTFMVSHDGVLYEKNLGSNTESIVLRMQRFNPNPTWKKVR
ncbi:DUF2950 domain-containing protein [Propionivibrio limicola]|uniref:DUF2950 domain-containing protein n=1 Tax=Propionivibrio limicola TaxID=167645 RepID=UPI00129177BA|nr:DUF2950 domain-containing protein [Propionivibrio limicola]